MSQIQILEPPKQEQQIKASEILRNTTVQQCSGQYEMGGRYCAVGAILHHFGYNNMFEGRAEYFDKARNAGIHLSKHIGEIIEMNDGERASFSEIASYLESVGQ